ncbi:MAG: TspO/MBR family protein [bacterium]
MKKGFKINYKVLIASLVVVYFIGFAGGLFTDTGDWYDSIKPEITPPGYVFAIVWNILFFLIAISIYTSYVKGSKEQKLIVLMLFGINLLLNFLWSVIFFGMQNPVLAFYELILFGISIISLIYYNYKINKFSSYLLIPYLIWICFAGYLNYLIAFV